MSDETKPPAQVLQPTGIKSEEAVLNSPPVPPAQVLIPTGIRSQEAVHQQPQSVIKAHQVVLLKQLSVLEDTLHRRSKQGNIQRRANLLTRINRLRKTLGMQPAKLQDF